MTRPHSRMPVQIAAEAIARASHEGVAFRELIQLSDDLTALTPAERAAVCEPPPPSTRRPVWDAALAAVVDWHLSADGSPLPDWVNDPERTLTSPGCTFAEPELVDHVLGHTPAEIARHRVYIAAETLRSV